MHVCSHVPRLDSTLSAIRVSHDSIHEVLEDLKKSLAENKDVGLDQDRAWTSARLFAVQCRHIAQVQACRAAAR